MAHQAQQNSPGGTLGDFAKQLTHHIEQTERLKRGGVAPPGAFRALEDQLESYGAALDTITALYDQAAQTLEEAGEILGCAMDEDSADAMEPSQHPLDLFRNAEQEDGDIPAAVEDLTSSSQAVPVKPRGGKLRKF